MSSILWWEWGLYLAVNVGIGVYYKLIPKKLKSLMESQRYVEDTIADIVSSRAKNLQLMRAFIQWCGIHHDWMVPLMVTLAVFQWMPAFWILVAIDSTVLLVSAHAYHGLSVPKVPE